MSLVEYIFLALALAIPTAISLRSSARQSQIRLSKALVVVLAMALIHACFLLLGMFIGNMLRFEMPDVDRLVYLGFFIIVAFKLLLPALRKKNFHVQGYDISRWGTALALSIATGLNVLMIGIGLGFIVNSLQSDLFKASVPMAVAVFLLGYWAVMLGRQKQAMKERRWLLIATLFLLISAIFNATDFL